MSVSTIDEQTICRFQTDNDSDVELAIPHDNDDDDDDEVVIDHRRNTVDRPSTSSATSVTSKYDISWSDRYVFVDSGLFIPHRKRPHTTGGLMRIRTGSNSDSSELLLASRNMYRHGGANSMSSSSRITIHRDASSDSD